MPYRRFVRVFSLVPLAASFTVVVFVLLLYSVWPSERWSSTFASYLGLSVFAAATWIVSFALRIPLYLGSSFLRCSIPMFTPFLSTFFQVLVEETLRLCSIILMRIHLLGDLGPSDPAFPSIWALATGWAIADVTVSVWQGYAQLSLYKDLMSPDDLTLSPHGSLPSVWISNVSPRLASPDTAQQNVYNVTEEFIHKEIDKLMLIRARVELEEVYGVPIPVCIEPFYSTITY